MKSFAFWRKIALASMILIAVMAIALPRIYEPCEKLWQEKLYGFVMSPFILVLYSVFLLALVVWVRPFFPNMISWLIVMLVLCFFATSILLASLSTPRSKTIDGTRAAGVTGLRITLEIYRDTNSRYPTQLSELDQRYVPKDPVTGKLYEYRVSDDGQKYVLGVEIGKEIVLDSCYNKRRFPRNIVNSAQDLDGIVFGLQCDDPMYCITN